MINPFSAKEPMRGAAPLPHFAKICPAVGFTLKQFPGDVKAASVIYVDRGIQWIRISPLIIKPVIP